MISGSFLFGMLVGFFIFFAAYLTVEGMDSKTGGRVLRVSSSEVSGPDGAGSSAEINANNPRQESDIKLMTPRSNKGETQ